MKWKQINNSDDETCLICTDCEVATTLYYPISKKLVITEKGKYFDDHAAADFENISLEDAIKIVEHLTVFRTV